MHIYALLTQTDINLDGQSHIGRQLRTQLGDEEHEHNDGGNKRYNTAWKRPAVEILIDLRVRIQAPNFPKYTLHRLTIHQIITTQQKSKIQTIK